MSGQRKKVTVGAMIQAGGLLSFRRALRFASRYGLACEALGHPPTIAEYQEFHGLARAQAYRDFQSWKKCVPGYSVLEVVSDEALKLRGLSESDREDAIARELAE
jgi:hypothetical protein